MNVHSNTLSLSLSSSHPSILHLPPFFHVWALAHVPLSSLICDHSHSDSHCSVSIFNLTTWLLYLYFSPWGTHHIPWIVIGFSHILNVCGVCACAFPICVIWCKYHWLRKHYCTCTTLKPCLLLNINRHEIIIDFFYLATFMCPKGQQMLAAIAWCPEFTF